MRSKPDDRAFDLELAADVLKLATLAAWPRDDREKCRRFAASLDAIVGDERWISSDFGKVTAVEFFDRCRKYLDDVANPERARG